jgi:hypothetical protein
MGGIGFVSMRQVRIQMRKQRRTQNNFPRSPEIIPVIPNAPQIDSKKSESTRLTS